MMEKVKKAIAEVHLYPNKVEYLIKLAIWMVSWIAGISVLTKETGGVGSAYFIYSLSLLMEFLLKIKEKNSILSRVLHTLFCFAIGAMTILSSRLLFAAQYVETLHTVLDGLAYGILGFMILDCAVLWCSKEDSVSNNPPKYDQSQMEKRILHQFEQRLRSGSLGDIDGGE